MSLDPNSSYYDAGGIETIEIIRAKLTKEQFRGWLLGNAIKYSTRLMHKGTPDRDAEKLSTYASLLNDELESDEEPQTVTWSADDLNTCDASDPVDGFWVHKCPGYEGVKVHTALGYGCNWCPAKSPKREVSETQPTLDDEDNDFIVDMVKAAAGQNQ